MDDNDDHRKNLKLIPENEMFGAKVFGRSADFTDIVTNAGYKGRGMHKNVYRTHDMSWVMTKILADMLGKGGDVKIYLIEKYGSGEKRKPYDLTWKENGKDKIKIRHIYSVLRIHNGSRIPYYEYQINYREYQHHPPDIFMLTGWIEIDDILYPTRFWIISAEERIKTQRTEMEFKDKTTFTIYETKNGITRMKKYEDNDKLENLKNYKLDMKHFRST